MNNRILILLVVTIAGIIFLESHVSFAQVPANTVYLDIEAPRDSQVYVNGYLTQSTGTQRHYFSTGLEAGRVYPYRIIVAVNDNGQTIRREEVVKLRAGERKSLSLQVVMKPPSADPNMPPDSNLRLRPALQPRCPFLKAMLPIWRPENQNNPHQI